MLEGDEVMQQDANIETEETSAASETSPQEITEVSAEESSQQTAATQSVPFHEDPKVQDYIERQIAKRASQYEKQLADIQKQFQEQPKPQQAPKKAHPFVEALSSIDPKYGEWAGSVEQLREELQQFKSWQQAEQSKNLVNQYNTQIDSLHTELKTAPELKEFIKEQLDARAMRDPQFGLNDVPKTYRELHEKYTKLLEGAKRSATAQYVQDKTKDSSAPTSQPKGKPATKQKAPQFKDREEALASIVRKAVNASKAESDI